MADFEEDSVFTEGVRAFEATDPARFDVLNDTIKPLVDRTRYLYDNMGQGGGSQGTPVEWIEANDNNVDISSLTPGNMYILDTRNGKRIDIVVNEDSAIPVGSEFHFVCAGDPAKAYIYEPGGSMIITAEGLVSLSDSPPFNKNGSVVTLKKISETDWLLFGDIAEGNSGGFPYGGEGEFSASPQTFTSQVQLATTQGIRNTAEAVAEAMEAPLCDVIGIALGNAQLMAIGSVITASSYENVPLATEPPEGGTWVGPYIVGAAVRDLSVEPPQIVAQSRAVGSLFTVGGDQVAVIEIVEYEGFPYTVTHDAVNVALNPGTPELNAAVGIGETSLTASAVFDDQEAVVASVFPECSI